MNNLTVSHYNFYCSSHPKWSSCNIILYFTRLKSHYNLQYFWQAWNCFYFRFFPKPFLWRVWLEGTKSWALLLHTNVHLYVLCSQWLSVSGFVWASYAPQWRVTSCTHTYNFTRMLNLTLPVQIKWSRIHFDCYRNPPVLPEEPIRTMEKHIHH